jgi:hypothetical protein
MGIEISISVEELRKRKIMLATPMYGGMCHGLFTKSSADLSANCAKHGIGLVFYYLFNESLIQRARNYCVDEFLRSDCTHLMFVDADIGFKAEDVIAFLALQSDESPYDVLCGPYPKKCISWEKIVAAVNAGFADDNPSNLEQFVGDYVFNPRAGQTEIKLDEPAPIEEGGTGFMMIRRSILEKYRDAFPELKYYPDHARSVNFDGSRAITAFFDCEIDRGATASAHIIEMAKKLTEAETIHGAHDALIEELRAAFKNGDNPATRRYLSEDYFFCRNVWRIGGQVWLAPWIQLSHTGTYTFGGSLAALAQIGAAATVDSSKIKPK